MARISMPRVSMSRVSMSRVRAAVAATALLLAAGGAEAAESVELKHRDWPQSGPFGTFDRASLQRGFLVYKDVCAGCHAVQYLHYRQLEGIGLSEAEIRAVAAEATVTDGPNDEGEMFERPGQPNDRLPKPFANDAAARAANGGSLPPDLSLMVKARVGHEDYLYSLMTGYGTPPADMTMREGMTYNAYFPGHQIAMPPPLGEDAVEFADGTAASVDQMAYDVTNFLAWVSEPTLETRKATGVKVVLFLLIFAGLAYAVKRKVWADLH
jgi:ubiquinol-cytochrome c reductase cytochrome c1 subunit